MRRTFSAVGAAALLSVSEIVTAQYTEKYCDSLGRCFNAFINQVGISYGVAIPEVASAPFDTILQVTAPIEVAWAGVSWSSTMAASPLIVTWPYQGTIKASARVAYSYSSPMAYDAATVKVLDGSYANSTHWVSTILCSGCSSWPDVRPYPPNSLDPNKAVPLGFVYSTTPVFTPGDQNSLLKMHDHSDVFDLSLAQAKSSKFGQWAGEIPSNLTIRPRLRPRQAPIPSTCNLQSQFPLQAASGWRFVKLAGSLRTPRGLAVDTSGNLLVIQVGVGLTAFTFNSNGCIASNKVLISRPALTHGVALNPEGTKVFVSSSTTVWQYDYNPSTQTTSNEKVVVKNMYPSSHSTRTLVIPPATPNLLVVSIGSDGNLDGAAINKATGRALVKVFDISTSPSGGYDYSTQGHFLGYGLRNEIALAVDNNNMVWGVENSADEFKRVINGQTTDIHEENPAEELNYLGDPSVPNEQWYGYPTCFTVWGGQQFPDSKPATGSQFIPQPNSTFSDATCAERSVPPRLSFRAHAAPIDAKFDPEGENLFVSLHGSWNKNNPYGYRVVTVPFKTNAEGGYEPVAAANSQTGYTDILWDTQQPCDMFRCFRPSGITWDRDFTRLFIASDNLQQGELYILSRT